MRKHSPRPVRVCLCAPPQLQTLESRRENEERARRKAEVLRLKAERAEELALELGTSVLKIPHNAFGIASHFSKASRPRPVTIKLFHIRAPRKSRQEREAGAAESSGRGNDGDGVHEARDEAKQAAAAANGSSSPSSSPPVDEWYIIWEPSKRKSELQRTIHLNEAQLILGANAGVFAANPKVSRAFAATPEDAKRCASFLIPANPAIGREATSFDVVFETVFDVDAWIKVLRRSNILKIKLASAAPNAAAAAAGKKGEKAAAAAAPAEPKKGKPQPLHFEDDTPAAAPAAAVAPSAAVSSSPPPPISAAAFDSPSGADPPPKSRRGKSRKSAQAVVEDEDDEEPPPVAAPKQRRVMRRPKDEEEADELDVREF